MDVAKTKDSVKGRKAFRAVFLIQKFKSFVHQTERSYKTYEKDI